MFKYFIIYIAAMSLIDLVLYGADKAKAKAGRRRIKETVLLGSGFLGGAAGALLGMLLFRHKTKHMYFWAVNLLGLAAHIAAAVYLLR